MLCPSLSPTGVQSGGAKLLTVIGLITKHADCCRVITKHADCRIKFILYPIRF